MYISIMDFSALNPLSTNAVSLAAGSNDAVTLRHLLDMGKNPNCNDNRGWTSLHASAASDAYESVKVLLEYPITSVLAETFEGHTALYLACRNKCSLRTITLLLQYGQNIAEYASNEMVSPLHVVCCQGRIDVAEALVAAGSIINLQDSDGDSPLHEAARRGFAELSSILLHAGADPSLRNSWGLSPFLLACFRGAIDCVRAIFPFVINVNERAYDGNTGLILAAQRGALEVAKFLLENNANPNIKNNNNELPMYIALTNGHSEIFKLLFPVTDLREMRTDLMSVACKPLYFSMGIVTALLESDLDPIFFTECERFLVILDKIFDFRPFYTINPPFSSILNVIEYIYNSSEELCETLLYLLLMKGVSVNPLFRQECPPLVYLHYTEHINCRQKVIDILVSQDCDVDYSTMPADSALIIPDSIIASVSTGGHTLQTLLTYTIKVDPEDIITKLVEHSWCAQRVSIENLLKIIPMCWLSKKVIEGLQEQFTQYYQIHQLPENPEIANLLRIVRMPALKHLSRKVIRKQLRKNISNTSHFLYALKMLPIPNLLKLYIRFL